tara:strand:+ start:2174 stop:2932 length:759 start_codon:yes stop_codon:yes gene_type:complete
MSLPSGGTSFTSARIIDYWRVYPFANDGDTVSVEYKFRIMVDSDSYTAPAYSDALDDATAAKVISVPVTDGNAYFTGDDGFSSANGNNMVFTRTFARVPVARTRGNGSFSFPWPAFKKWDDDTQPSNRYVFDIDYADFVGLPPEYEIRPPNSASSPSKITYTYTYATDIASVSTDGIWSPIWPDNAGIYDYRNQIVPYLCDAGSGGNPSGTNVTAAIYKSSYINTLYLVVSSSIEAYKGNIFVRKTIRALAQ